jgi:hypothetical protein
VYWGDDISINCSRGGGEAVRLRRCHPPQGGLETSVCWLDPSRQTVGPLFKISQSGESCFQKELSIVPQNESLLLLELCTTLVYANVRSY